MQLLKFLLHRRLIYACNIQRGNTFSVITLHECDKVCRTKCLTKSVSYYDPLIQTIASFLRDFMQVSVRAQITFT